jgi:hypothetical protein
MKIVSDIVDEDRRMVYQPNKIRRLRATNRPHPRTSSHPIISWSRW